MAALFDLKLFEGEFIKSINLDKKILNVEFFLKDEARVSALEKALKQKHLYFNSKFKENILSLEIK